MIGFQGENGTKLSGEVQISAMKPIEFKNMFSLILEPEKHQDHMISEAKRHIKDSNEEKDKNLTSNAIKFEIEP